MRVEIRKSAAGTEYWDNVEMRTVLVPLGSEPDFEVTKNPKTMVAGVDIANGKDLTVHNGKVDETAEERAEREAKEADEKDTAEQKAKEEDEAKAEALDTQTDIDLDEMNVEQLREFAKQNNINLPFNVKKEETIRKNIEDALTAADDE